MRRTGLTGLVVLMGFVLMGIAGPERASAQQERPAQAVIEGSLRATSIHGRTVGMAGAAALLRVGGDFFFGGAGYLMLRPLDLSQPGSGLELRMAYGGVLTGLRLHEGGRFRWDARLLVGAGNAKAIVPVVGTELRSDNFGVVEPEITASIWAMRLVSVRVGAGYRFVYGVQGLPRVSPEQLRGIFIGASVAFGQF
jgi:hypothetical protein